MTPGDKIRVIIVDDIAETRETIRKLLQFDYDVEVVGVARTGREGIDIAKETKPDVIIMDINMPDMDGITATEMIRKTVPHTQIVILSVQGDPNYMRRAMLAGARDFLTKPPAVDELTSAIKRAGKMAQEERDKAPASLPMPSLGTAFGMPRLSQGKVIVVYSPKGGTGCTTVTVNLGATLHNEESPVVLVDGKLHFGDVAVFLNERGKNSVAELAPRADELDAEVVEGVLVTHAASGMKVLCAPSRPEFADEITGEQFSKVVQYLKNLFSYVVVDVSSPLTDVALATLDGSDLILLLTTQEIPAIRNARLFMDILTAMGIDHKRMLLVMNKFDRRIGITPEKISESFKHEVAGVLPLDEHLVVPSVNRGVPFMLADKSRSLPKAYLALAEAVRQRLTELSEQDAEAMAISGMGRLSGKQ